MRHCTGALSAFLEKSKYEDSTDIKDCAWQMGMRTDEHLFPYLVKHPEIGRLFGDAMGGYSLSRARWFDDGCVDVAKVLNLADESAVVEGEKGKVMLVDVAGGAGHDIELFRKKFPEIKERLVLQDLPSVIEMYEKQHPDGVEAMAHDIFTAQPILGKSLLFLTSRFSSFISLNTSRQIGLKLNLYLKVRKDITSILSSMTGLQQNAIRSSPILRQP